MIYRASVVSPWSGPTAEIPMNHPRLMADYPGWKVERECDTAPGSGTPDTAVLRVWCDGPTLDAIAADPEYVVLSSEEDPDA